MTPEYTVSQSATTPTSLSKPRLLRGALSMLLGLSALFVLLGLSNSLLFGSSAKAILAQDLNAEARLADVRELLGVIDVPIANMHEVINQVFLDGAVTLQRDQMREYYLSFTLGYQELLTLLEGQTEQSSLQIVAYIEDLDASVHQMMREAESVYSYLQAQQLELAVERLTIVNNSFAQSVQTLASAEAVLHALIVEELQTSARELEALNTSSQTYAVGLLLAYLLSLLAMIRVLQGFNARQQVSTAKNTLFETLFDALPTGVICCNASAQMLTWNERAICLSSGEFALLKPIEPVFAAMNIDFKSLDDLKAIAQPLRVETKDNNGRNLHLEISVRLVKQYAKQNDSHLASANASEALTDLTPALIITLRDVTEQAATTTSLARSQAKLRLEVFRRDLIGQQLRTQTQMLEVERQRVQTAYAGKTRFLADMSHELRTPMHSILGFARLLQVQLSDSSQQEAIRRIVSAGDHLLGVLQNVLDIAKLETQAMALVAEPFELADELSTVVATFSLDQRQLPEKGQLDFLSFIQSDLPKQINGDKVRFRQLLINLLANAFQFTRRGEITLEIEGRERATAQDEQTQYLAGNYLLVIRVKDTGVGMSPKQQQQIFEPFAQAETRPGGGIGLGLAISQQIVTAMAGTIEVKSSPGIGSCFEVQLPIKVVMAAPAPLDIIGEIAVVSHNKRFVEWVRAALRPHEQIRVFTRCDQQVLTWLQSDSTIKQCIVDGRLERSCVDTTLSMLAPWRQNCIEIVHFEAQSSPAYALAKQSSRILYAPVLPWRLREQLVSGGEVVQQVQFNVPNLQTQAILVVEDVASNREYLVELLQPTQAKVVSVATAEDAIALCQTQKFGLIILDLHLPKLSGFAASKQLRRLDGCQQSAIIGVTADDVSAVLADCIDCGMSSCLAKPIEPQDLYRILAFLLAPVQSETAKSQAGRLATVALPEINGVDVVTALGRLGDRLDLYQRMISTFTIRTSTLIEQLGALLEQGQYVRMTQLLSSMRGSALSVGALRLGEAMLRSEIALQETAEPAPVLAVLEQELIQANQALDQVRLQLDDGNLL